jgi:hypothetical protein
MCVNDLESVRLRIISCLDHKSWVLGFSQAANNDIKKISVFCKTIEHILRNGAVKCVNDDGSISVCESKNRDTIDDGILLQVNVKINDHQCVLKVCSVSNNG